MVAADAAARHDDGAGRELELADRRTAAGHAPVDGRRLEQRPADAGHRALVDHEAVDLVPELERDPAAVDVLADPALERRDDAGPGAPRQVEARHRVAVAVGAAVTALGPADDREEPVAHLAQPRALLAVREVQVGLGPLPRPVVLLAVELRAAHPVLGRQLDRVLDAHPALLGAVHQEQPAEAPERLAAEALLALLVQQQDAATPVGGLGRGDEPGEAGSYDDDVCVHGATLGRGPG